MGPLRIGVATTRPGQGSSMVAASLGWTLAAERRVALIDCDMAGGTLGDLLHVDPEGRTLEELIGRPEVTKAGLQAMLSEVPERPNLNVLAGIANTSMPVSRPLRLLADAIEELGEEVVILDLGAPFSYPGCDRPWEEAEAITDVCDRLFVVVRDDPALLVRTIESLHAARPAHAELVVVQQYHGRVKREAADILRERAGEYPIRYEISFDPKAAARLATTGVPPILKGVERDLGLGV